MDVDRLTVAVRPRAPWEAVDLGVALLRREWRGVAASALPAYLVAVALAMALTGLAGLNHGWGILLLWWLKPLHDRFILLPLSRALFGESFSLATWRAELPRILFRSGLLAALTWRRLSLSRAFTLPVWMLEGAAHWPRQTRAGRLRVLRARTTGTARALTVIGYHIEASLIFGLVMLALFLAPPMMGDSGFDFATAETWPTWLRVGLVMVAALATLLVEPLYVAGGFLLYLNRRIDLEGWDIELAFRRIAKRLAQHEGAGEPATEAGAA